MHLVIRFLTVLLVAATVIGSPVQSSKNSLTINQVLKPRFVSENTIPHRGIAAYAKALGKYGAPAEKVHFLNALALKHGDLLSRAEQAHARSASTHHQVSSSSVTSSEGGQSSVYQAAPSATPKVAGPITAIPGPYDLQYVAQILIGDQAFWMDFDTGSADFWVFGPNITGLAANQTQWHQSSTSTQLANYSFYISYGDGSYASGSVWKDQVVLGSVNIPNATVEVADVAFGTFEPPSSGVLGLAFDSINLVSPVPQKTLFTDLIDQGLISRPVLAADLKHNAAGCYTFGDIPWWQYSGAITYAPVDQTQGFWMFSPLGFGVGGNSSTGLNTTTSASKLLHGLVDTGTTLILIDDRIAAAYWAQVASAILDVSFFGGYIFNCSEALPDFKLLVGETGKATYTITVPGQYVNYAPLGSGICFGGIQPTFGQIPFNVYGDVLIKSAFVVFDRGSNGQAPRMGFADKSSN